MFLPFWPLLAIAGVLVLAWVVGSLSGTSIERWPVPPRSTTDEPGNVPATVTDGDEAA